MCPLKILVAGTGSIGQRHVANIQALEPGAHFVVLRGSGHKDEFSQRIRGHIVQTVDEALNSCPDCAVIATPSALHADLLVPLILSGLPIYVEKPVVTTSEQVARVRQALRNGTYTGPSMVGLNLRFLPSLRCAHDLVSSGTIGHVARASFEAGQWLPDWRPGQSYREGYSAWQNLGGGVLLDLIHEVDMACWMLGQPREVEVMFGQCSALEIETESVATLLVRHGPGNVISAISLDYVARVPMRRYCLVGDEGTLIWDLARKELSVEFPGRCEYIRQDDQAFDLGQTYVAAMRSFLEAVKSGRQTHPDIAEGLVSAEVAILARGRK